jgi:hypothetical protein
MLPISPVGRGFVEGIWRPCAGDVKIFLYFLALKSLIPLGHIISFVLGGILHKKFASRDGGLGLKTNGAPREDAMNRDSGAWHVRFCPVSLELMLLVILRTADRTFHMRYPHCPSRHIQSFSSQISNSAQTPVNVMFCPFLDRYRSNSSIEIMRKSDQ